MNRKRKNLKKYPDHINAEKLPDHVGFDPRGKGYFYYRKRKGKYRGKQLRLGNRDLTLAQIYAAVEHLEKQAKDTLRAISLGYQESRKWKKLAESTQDDYKKCHKTICERETRYGNKLGDLPLKSWDAPAVERFKEARAEESETRAKREIIYLRNVFQWSIRNGYMKTNPAKEVDVSDLGGGRTHYVENKDYLAAINIAPLNIAIMMHIAYLTGRRRQDIVKLHKGFNLWRDGLYVEESKTKKECLVTWSDDLRETIQLAKELSGDSDWLFPGKCPKHHYTLSALDTAWQKVCIKLTKLGLTRFQFRDIRAKHATDLEDNGGDATANLLHSDRSLTEKHYLRKPKPVKVKSLQ